MHICINVYTCIYVQCIYVQCTYIHIWWYFNNYTCIYVARNFMHAYAIWQDHWCFWRTNGEFLVRWATWVEQAITLCWLVKQAKWGGPIGKLLELLGPWLLVGKLKINLRSWKNPEAWACSFLLYKLSSWATLKTLIEIMPDSCFVLKPTCFDLRWSGIFCRCYYCWCWWQGIVDKLLVDLWLGVDALAEEKRAVAVTATAEATI